MNLERRVLIGHRGCAHRPENTLAAFEHGLADGADGVECDVRQTADGELVVVHDEDLSRSTDVVCRLPNRPTTVGALTLAEIRALDAGGGAIPTLDELLGLIAATSAFLNIEVKRADAARVLSAIRQASLADRVIVSNFDHEWLADFKRRDHGIACSALLGGRLHDPGRYVREVLGADVLAPGTEQATEALFESARHHRVPVHVWTVNQAAEARTLLRMGASGIFSDVPDQIRPAVT